MTTATPRAFLLVLLVYVTLDLSLPAMPGAFVFDPSGSVESVQSRGRQSVEVVPLAPPGADSFGVRPAVTPAVRRSLVSAATQGRRPEPPLPRAAVGPGSADPVPASADPD